DGVATVGAGDGTRGCADDADPGARERLTLLGGDQSGDLALGLRPGRSAREEEQGQQERSGPSHRTEPPVRGGRSRGSGGKENRCTSPMWKFAGQTAGATESILYPISHERKGD